MAELDTKEVLAAQQDPSASPTEPPKSFLSITQTSKDRLEASVDDHALNVDALVLGEDTSADALKAREKTILYLAYGSNLSSETFRKTRGIVPVSQVCVCVPDLTLTFDLPGLPYLEPCFAATQYREPPSYDADPDPDSDDNGDGALANGNVEEPLLAGDGPNPIWPKPLVGVVYEVTLSDYARIIATEGGGSSYVDVLINCHPFPETYDPSDSVPDSPVTAPFKAHTLLSPHSAKDDQSHSKRKPLYARPSPRYKNLLVMGAKEHDLPAEYRRYLSAFPAYEARTRGQRMGKTIFGILWGPLFIFFMVVSKGLVNDKGRSPWWLAKAQRGMFETVWATYDILFEKLFGDGER